MSRKTHIILLLLAGFLLAHVKARGQNISEIAQSDPLIITGTIGTQNTYRYSSAGTEYGSPFSIRRAVPSASVPASKERMAK